MPGGEDFILRPALAFNIDQKDLNSGAVDLCRIALLNDYLDMREDNDARVDKWRAANER
nr:lytic transglycosylase [Enterobacter roggenkampii]